ncbi:hypothetical protein PMAYCL1PPCAC_21789, partial [Pristionchus mayeri]
IFLLLVLFSLVAVSLQKCCGFYINCGRCNIFCCNCCPGVCMHENFPCSGGKRSIFEDPSSKAETNDRFNSIDWNGDGVISDEEAREFILNVTSTRTKREINEG